MTRFSEEDRVRLIAYDSLFSTPNGQQVLNILREELGVEESHSHAEMVGFRQGQAIDPVSYWLGEGRKSVYWHIMAKLRAANQIRGELP